MINEVETFRDTAILIIKRRSGAILRCEIDRDDLQRVISFWHKWSAFWSETAKTWYVYCRAGDRREIVLLHRFLLNTPSDLHVDHRDHNGLNNRRRNIRNVTRSVNQLNHRMQTNNTSGYRGVVWDKSRSLWQARVKVEGRNTMLGRFSNPEQANAAIATYRKDVLGCLS